MLMTMRESFQREMVRTYRWSQRTRMFEDRLRTVPAVISTVIFPKCLNEPFLQGNDDNYFEKLSLLFQLYIEN